MFHKINIPELKRRLGSGLCNWSEPPLLHKCNGDSKQGVSGLSASEDVDHETSVSWKFWFKNEAGSLSSSNSSIVGESPIFIVKKACIMPDIDIYIYIPR